jgi:hypothetical protein
MSVSMGLAVELEVIDGAAALLLPTAAGVSSYRIDFLLFWRNDRIEWSDGVSPGTSSLLAPPAEAHVESMQDHWLSRIRMRVVALDAFGNPLGEEHPDDAWIVWPDGSGEDPRWLDAAARAIEAPYDAWSIEARAAVSTAAASPDLVMSFEPPGGDL